MITKYTTNAGDNIYSIAAAAYGDAMQYQRIFTANPTLPIISSYPAGLVVVIPILEGVEVAQANSLPFWK